MSIALLARCLLLILLLNKPYKTTALRQKKKKNKQSNSPLTLQGSIPPVTLIKTSTSAKKVTFTQTRAHKYLTQMDDIFQGSSLYATSQLQFLHEDKETWMLLWAFGVWQDPP